MATARHGPGSHRPNRRPNRVGRRDRRGITEPGIAREGDHQSQTQGKARCTARAVTAAVVGGMDGERALVRHRTSCFNTSPGSGDTARHQPDCLAAPLYQFGYGPIKAGNCACPSRDGFTLERLINSNDDFSTGFRGVRKNNEINYSYKSLNYTITPDRRCPTKKSVQPPGKLSHQVGR